MIPDVSFKPRYEHAKLYVNIAPRFLDYYDTIIYSYIDR